LANTTIETGYPALVVYRAGRRIGLVENVESLPLGTPTSTESGMIFWQIQR
jgi:hypothetical protein